MGNRSKLIKKSINEIASLENKSRILDLKLNEARLQLGEKLDVHKTDIEELNSGLHTPREYNDDQIAFPMEVYETWKTTLEGAQALKAIFPWLSLFFFIDSHYKEGLVILTNYKSHDSHIITSAINNINMKTNHIIDHQQEPKMFKFRQDVIDELVEL